MKFDPIYYCSYVDAKDVEHKCGSHDLAATIRHAKNLSCYHHRISVTAHYANGGIKKVGFAEAEKFFAI